MNNEWNYKEFNDIFDWCQKSNIGSRSGKSVGKYKLYIASASEIKYYDEYLEDTEALIFGTGGNPCIHYESGKFAYTNHCEAATKKNENICTKFYYYFFQKDRYSDLQSTFVGGGIKNSSKKRIGKLLVPVPHIEEQRRIVAKIEELFSKLDEGIAELNRVKKQLEIYRQALLKEAFERCESTKAVNDVCIYVTDGDHMPPPKADRGIPFIMISNITNNVIDFTNTHFVKEEYYNNIGEKRTPRNGDVLYTVTGSYGIPVLINFDTKFCFQRHIALLRPNETIKQKFLYYAMQTPYVYKQATQKATGTAQKTVGLTVLRNIQIPYADLESQQYIVNNIEQKLSICDKVAQTVNESLQKAENLRQSILKQAFEGELV